MWCDSRATARQNAIPETIHADEFSNSQTTRKSFSSIFAELFSSLKRPFQSQPAPIGTKTHEDLTNIKNTVDVDLENGTHTVQSRSNGSLKKFTLLALLVNYVGYRILESQMAATPKMGTAIGDELDATLGISTAMFRQYAHNRQLLSSPTFNDSIPTTEENFFSEVYDTWDFFPYQNLGRLIVSTTSSLPVGVNLIQSPMQVLNSIANSQYSGFAVTNNALYVSQSGNPTIQIINIETVSNPSVTNVIKTGSVVGDMKIIGNYLYCVGGDNIIKIFDISKPFSPIPLGEVSVPGSGVFRMVSTGVDHQFGCISQNTTYCVDVSDPSHPILTGSLPGLNLASSIAASPGYFYISTAGGLVIVNATNPNSLTQCGSFSTSRLTDVKYSNGFCYATTFTGGLIVINVLNPAAPILVNNINYSPEIMSGLSEPSDGLMPYISSLGMGFFDLSNQTLPKIIASAVFPGAGTRFTFQENSDLLVFGTLNNINIAKSRDRFSLSGTPKGGSQGVYDIDLTATTLDGQVIDNKTITLKVSPAITTSSNLPDLVAGVGLVFNEFINTSAFNQANGIPLRFTLECDKPIGSSLNPVSAQLSWIPTDSDVGTTTCDIEATDADGAIGKSSRFNFSVIYGPSLTSLANQVAYIGIPFSLNLSDSATSKSNSSKFSFEVSNLPPSLTLNNNTISGTPLISDAGNYQDVSVKVTNEYGISITKTITLNVVQPGVPFFRNSISSFTVFVGNDFLFNMPSDAAINPNYPNTEITYTASLADGSPLPSWMSFDGKSFYGTPPRTEIVWSDKDIPIVVTATQKMLNGKKATASTAFTMTVSGTSVTRTVVNVGSPTLSILLAAYAGRIRFFNYMASPRFISCVNSVMCLFHRCGKQKTTLYQSHEVFFERQSMMYAFKTPRSEIASFKTFYNGQPCPDGSLPHWLTSNNETDAKICQLNTDYVPVLMGINSIKIIAYDEVGYKVEEVTFTKETPVKIENHYQFSRPCKTPSNEIRKFIFRGADGKKVSQPHWFDYNKRLNHIKAEGAPSIEEIEPLTVLILGENKVVLEKICFNTPPKTKLVFDANELELEDASLLAAPASAPSIESKESSAGLPRTAVEMAQLQSSKDLPALIKREGKESGGEDAADEEEER